MSKEINKVVDKLKKTYGSLRIAGNEDETREYISTGVKALDLALDGGVAWGYVSEWSGKSGSGKTTLMQKMLADAQIKYGAIGIWLDRENAFHNDRALSLGIDLDKVMVVAPVDIPTVPKAAEILESVLSEIPKDEYKFIVIDSISAFADESNIYKSEMGSKARQIHRMFRKILPYLNNKTSLNFANHRTFKIGVLFGDPSTVTGGEGVKFYTSYRIKLDDKREIRDEAKGNEIIGNWIRSQIIKTRSGPNFRVIVFPHYYKTGIPYYGGYTRLLVGRNYLKPKNKKEFNAFKQVIVKYKDKEFSEHIIKDKLKDYPELEFSEYPEWNDKDEN